MYAGANNLEDVLGTIVQGAVSFSDPMVIFSNVPLFVMIMCIYMYVGAKGVLWCSTAAH